MIKVLKKADGPWLLFESSSGKSAMLNVSTLLNHGSIVNAAISETCEELAAGQGESAPKAPNSSSPKLPEFTKVYDAVKEWFDSAPDFARPCPADIVKVAYDFIAGNFGH